MLNVLKMSFSVIAEAARHVSAVLAAILVLVLLLLLAMIYVKCRLNMLLWYRDRYGELEINGNPWGFHESYFQCDLHFGFAGGSVWEGLSDPDFLGFCCFSKGFMRRIGKQK